MREDLKKRRQEAAKQKGKQEPEFTIAGVTPELEKMASGEYDPIVDDPLKVEAQKFARKGWGIHVEDQKEDSDSKKDRKVIKADDGMFEIVVNEKDAQKLERRRQIEELEEQKKIDEIEFNYLEYQRYMRMMAGEEKSRDSPGMPKGEEKKTAPDSLYDEEQDT